MHLEKQPVTQITLLITLALSSCISNVIYLDSTIEPFELLLLASSIMFIGSAIVISCCYLWLMGDKTKMFGIW